MKPPTASKAHFLQQLVVAPFTVRIQGSAERALAGEYSCQNKRRCCSGAVNHNQSLWLSSAPA